MRNYVQLLKRLKFNKSNVVWRGLYSYRQRVPVIKVVKMLWTHNIKDNEGNYRPPLLGLVYGTSRRHFMPTYTTYAPLIA